MKAFTALVKENPSMPPETVLVPLGLDIKDDDLVVIGETTVGTVVSLQESVDAEKALNGGMRIVRGVVNDAPYRRWHDTYAKRNEIRKEIQRIVSEHEWLLAAQAVAAENPKLQAVLNEYLALEQEGKA